MKMRLQELATVLNGFICLICKYKTFILQFPLLNNF